MTTNSSDNSSLKDIQGWINSLRKPKIPHWPNLTSDLSYVEVHGFLEASQTAMAAAVYLGVSHPNQPSKVNLVWAKTQVAPRKLITIPQLALSVALLLTKLISRMPKALNLINVPVTLWIDSSVTLAWGKNSDPVAVLRRCEPGRRCINGRSIFNRWPGIGRRINVIKHPPILPKTAYSHMTSAPMLILHRGTQLTLNYIRMYCRIVGGRARIKGVRLSLFQRIQEPAVSSVHS